MPTKTDPKQKNKDKMAADSQVKPTTLADDDIINTKSKSADTASQDLSSNAQTTNDEFDLGLSDEEKDSKSKDDSKDNKKSKEKDSKKKDDKSKDKKDEKSSKKDATKKDEKSSAGSKFLKKVKCIIDVNISDGDASSTEEYKKKLEDAGAAVQARFSKNLTHVVFKDGKQALLDNIKKESDFSGKIVSPLWVDACLKEGKIVDEKDYELDVSTLSGSKKKDTKKKDDSKDEKKESKKSDSKKDEKKDSDKKDSKKKKSEDDEQTEESATKASSSKDEKKDSKKKDEKKKESSKAKSPKDEDGDVEMKDDEETDSKKKAKKADSDKKETKKEKKDDKKEDKKEEKKKDVKKSDDKKETKDEKKKDVKKSDDKKEKKTEKKKIGNKEKDEKEKSTGKKRKADSKDKSDEKKPKKQRKDKEQTEKDEDEAKFAEEEDEDIELDDNESDDDEEMDDSEEEFDWELEYSVTHNTFKENVKHSKKAIVAFASRIPQQQKDVLLTMISDLSSFVKAEKSTSHNGVYEGERFTHLIAEDDERSEKVFFAIAFGAYIVTPDWLKDSLEKKTLLDEKPYLRKRFLPSIMKSREANAPPAPRKKKQDKKEDSKEEVKDIDASDSDNEEGKKNLKLFANNSFSIIGKTKMRRPFLETLITICGGTITAKRVTPGLHYVIVGEGLKPSETAFNSDNTYVTESFLFECLSNYEIVEDINKFALKESDLKAKLSGDHSKFEQERKEKSEKKEEKTKQKKEPKKSSTPTSSNKEDAEKKQDDGDTIDED